MAPLNSDPVPDHHVGSAVPPGEERPFRPALSVRFGSSFLTFYNNLASFRSFTNGFFRKKWPFFHGFPFRRVIFHRAGAEKRKNGLIPDPARAILSWIDSLQEYRKVYSQLVRH